MVNFKLIYKGKVVSVHDMMANLEMKVQVQLHSFLSSAPDGGAWQASLPGHITSCEKASGTHRTRGEVGLGACLDTGEKSFAPQWSHP